MTLYDDRVRLAQQIARRLLDRYGDVIRAINLHGSMARGPDAVDERSDIDLLVVTDAPDAIGEREVFLDGVFISLGVNTVQALLDRAGTVSWDWAIVSDQYVNTFVLHDPDGFFDRLQEVQEDAVRRTTAARRAEQAQGLVMGANEWLTKADRSLDGGDLIAASVCVTEALIVLSFAVGLFTQTRWHGSHLAVAGAAEAGRDVVGFSDVFGLATDVDRDVRDRLSAAHGACDALRSFFDGLGVRSVVGSVEELVM